MQKSTRTLEQPEAAIIPLVAACEQAIYQTHPLELIQLSDKISQVPMRTVMLTLLKSSRATVATFALTVIYLQRFSYQLKRVLAIPNRFSSVFDAKQVFANEGIESLLCPRRVFLVALMLATKVHRDTGARFNFQWERITGLSLASLNEMEREFLNFIQHELFVSVETYDAILARLSRCSQQRDRMGF
jgi:hypothetical protein